MNPPPDRFLGNPRPPPPSAAISHRRARNVARDLRHRPSRCGGAAVMAAAWMRRRQRIGVGSAATAAAAVWRRQLGCSGGGSKAAVAAARRQWQLAASVEADSGGGSLTAARCYVLSTLVLIFSYMSRSIMINHDPLDFID